VDNGSSDGSAEAFKTLVGPHTHLLRLSNNLGFAGGANAGIKVAKGDAVCLLNSDTIPTAGWLSRMNRVRLKQNAGLVGPYTNKAKGPQRKKPIHRWFPFIKLKTRELPMLPFFCVLIDRKVLDAIGLLDERFGLGTFEDDDYCRRARDAGFTCFVAGNSWVWHEGHATFNANGLSDAVEQERNQAVYDAKWRSR
jgi:GT2 family glycosyltransferase